MTNLVEWVAVKDSPTTIRVNGFPSLKNFGIMSCENLVTIPNHDFPSLENLNIIDVGCSILLFDMACSLSSLRELRLNCKYSLTCVPSMLFDINQHLEVLHVSDYSNLTDILFPEDNKHSLQSLQHLEINNCQKFASFTVDWQGMQSLWDVIINGCPSRRSIPQDIGGLSSLKFLTLGFFTDDFDMLKQTLHCIRGLTSLWELKINGCEEWVCVPDQLQHLTNITSLILDGYGVEVLPEWFGNISSLEKLYLLSCRKLRQLPSKEAMQRLTKFKELSIF